MEKAREKLDDEINIIEIVKSWRYFDRAIHFLLTDKQRRHFKERSRYIAIDPDPKSEKVRRLSSVARHDLSDGFFSDFSDGENKIEVKNDEASQ